MDRAVRSYPERVWVQVRTRKKSCIFWFCCTFPFCAWLSTSIRGKQLNNCSESLSPSQFSSFSSKIACKWRQWFEWNIYIIFPLLLSWLFTKGPRKKLRRETIITATRPKSFHPKPETCVSLSTTHHSLGYFIHNFTKLVENQNTQAFLLIYFFRACLSVRFYKHQKWSFTSSSFWSRAQVTTARKRSFCTDLPSILGYHLWQDTELNRLWNIKSSSIFK